ncbi:hypothetical protein [Singulisphaera acidiphila]|uniref:Uncharacterized protein n=1 Tax=Singulisphaera acidiphila (strain ATCC BAA-1392 / DSM 18658 / VKM B-2454 / MOB10) TaxID=886293 RepID=L0D9G4_SINAD|nr:hypothetical protein [Singulisphaera acidiphila]AGA26034.1 hypothetical protein Sinac_1656 [Singulisphaera acidiphila DSM 18658]
MARDLGSVMPARVTVRFQTRRCNGAVSDSVPPWYVKTVNLADVLPDVGAGFNGEKLFHDAALALFNVGGTVPTNQTALDNLATQIAKDYYSWKQISFDEVYPEIIAPEVDGLTDLIVISYQIDQVWTRRLSAPFNAQPEELAHQDPANSGCADSTGVTVTKTPCGEFYGPPAVCLSGKPNLTRYKLCLLDGRLDITYVSTDIVQ